MNFFNYKNIVINLSNVFIFITVQMFFFYYIISRINIKVFEKKLIYIKPFSENLFENIVVDKKELDYNKKHNINLILTRVGPLLLIIFLTIIGLFVLNISRGEKWVSYEIKLLLFVILAFSTEVIIFFLVINKYDFIKMGSLFSYIFNNIDKDTKSKMVCDMILKDTNNNNYKTNLRDTNKNNIDINTNNLVTNNNQVTNNNSLVTNNNNNNNNQVTNNNNNQVTNNNNNNQVTNNNNNNNLVYEVKDFIPENNYSKF